MQTQLFIDDHQKKLLMKPYFYTLQDHLPTQKKQIQMWANILMAFFKKKNLSEFSRAQLESHDFLLFHNPNINRNLNKKFIDCILQQLQNFKIIQFKDSNMNSFFIYIISLDDLAECIYQWAKNRGKIGRVETIQFLCSNDETQDQPFWGLPEETIVEACKILSQRRKIDLFDMGDELNPNMMGIKFL